MAQFHRVRVKIYIGFSGTFVSFPLLYTEGSAFQYLHYRSHENLHTYARFHLRYFDRQLLCQPICSEDALQRAFRHHKVDVDGNVLHLIAVFDDIHDQNRTATFVDQRLFRSPRPDRFSELAAFNPILPALLPPGSATSWPPQSPATNQNRESLARTRLIRMQREFGNAFLPSL
ncbi:unnamed protein product [Caenorhabditis bovis]|uniref:Uncharacterized protein n=1 Tax=Caenorhabditis bovis TaxID=2654633 RepID=A0A8S1E8I5_9PELO|nr:unnamed protein product [Caenorhabditis bovis]